MSKKDVIELLIERYFNAQFFEQQALMDKVLDCRSISDFQKLKLDINSPVVASIFESAAFVDNDCKKLTNERLNQIFQNLKPVRSGSNFL